MGLLTLKRVPEPEIMDTGEEVEAYSSAATRAYLEAIDRTFVDHVGRLIGSSGLPFKDCRVLDFGCGPDRSRSSWLSAGPRCAHRRRRGTQHARAGEA